MSAAKWRPAPARANHDSDRSCACEQIGRMGSEPQFQRDRRGRRKCRAKRKHKITHPATNNRSPPKCRADAAAPNRKSGEGRGESKRREGYKKNTENPRERQAAVAMCGRRVPSIGDLKRGGHQQTESLEQRAPMAALA